MNDRQRTNLEDSSSSSHSYDTHNWFAILDSLCKNLKRISQNRFGVRRHPAPVDKRSGARCLNHSALDYSILGFTHVMRWPCWCTKLWQNVAQVLHNNRIKFPKDLFRCCSVNQHGRRDVTSKPKIGFQF